MNRVMPQIKRKTRHFEHALVGLFPKLLMDAVKFEIFIENTYIGAWPLECSNLLCLWYKMSVVDTVGHPCVFVFFVSTLRGS
jgi:hypothetical protein